MKILIVDDEPLARTRLHRMLEKIDDVEIVGEAKSGKEALLRSTSANADIVLLDIRMPEMDGIEAAMHLSRLTHPPAIIFTTAFSEYALPAFDANAVDYLLKPIRRERLKEAIKKARKVSRAQLIELSKHPNAESTRTHINANISGSLQLVSVEDIYYFQAEQKYVTVRYSGGQVLIDDSLKSLEEEFGENFIRIHRNSLASLSYIEKLERDSSGKFHIRFRHIEDRLEVSRRMLSATRKRLKKISRA